MEQRLGVQARRTTPKACCRTCTGRSARSAISLRTRSAPSSRRSSTRACATRVPDLDEQIARGEFGGLFGWLRQNVHGLGARVSAQELIEECHRQAAVGGGRVALPRIQIPRARNGRRQRRGMTAVAGRLLGDWRGSALLALIAGFAIAAFVVPPMPQPLSYHAFADCRTIWVVPNFFNVLSNLPFLVGGGLRHRAHLGGGGRFIDAREQLPYLVFFLGALLTVFRFGVLPRGARQSAAGLGSSADDARVRRAGRGRRSPSASISSSACARCGRCCARRRDGDLLVRHRADGRRQHHSVCRLPGLVDPGDRAAARRVPGAALQPRRAAGRGRRAGTGWPRSSRPSIWQVYRLLGGTLSGHTIKHVLAAFAVFAIVRQLRLREPLPQETCDPPRLESRSHERHLRRPHSHQSGLRRPRRSWARTCAAWSARRSRTSRMIEEGDA